MKKILINNLNLSIIYDLINKGINNYIKNKSSDKNKIIYLINFLIKKDKNGYWIYNLCFNKNIINIINFDFLIEKLTIKDKDGYFLFNLFYNNYSFIKKENYCNILIEKILEKDQTGELSFRLLIELYYKKINYNYNKIIDNIVKKDQTGEWIYKIYDQLHHFFSQEEIKNLTNYLIKILANKNKEYFLKALDYYNNIDYNELLNWLKINNNELYDYLINKNL